MCDSRRPLEGADSEPLPDDPLNGSEPLERRSEHRPLQVPEWRRRAMEAQEKAQFPWEAVTDLTAVS